MMNRDWKDFKSINGGLAGARDAFENACETLFREMHPNKHVSQVAVKHGDGGIDIFIGELGIEPITVVQCKFFLDDFGNSQHSQIRDSFKTAINSNKYELKQWILCLPRVIDIDETSWWFKWKDKQIQSLSETTSFIKLINGNELIDLMKKYELYSQVFQIRDSERIKEIHDILIPKISKPQSSKNQNVILFNNYTELNEEYYFQRNEDIEFNQSLEVSNVWTFGKSGMGKTALINRNLIHNKLNYLFCDLSPVTINSAADVLEEIICSIEEKFCIERCLKEKNKIKAIVKLLNDSTNQKIVIVIDELSISDNNLLQLIASNFISLVTHYNNFSVNKDLKFVISTISDPKQIVNNMSKASDYFQYICCDDWETYIESFFDMLNITLNLKIDDNHKSIVIKGSKNSPRVLKNIFRKIVTSNSISDESIQRIVKTTIQESC